MSPLEALGLDETADERDVKRAYAQRLKTARPDVDPQAFQQLHEAYQSALAYLRWKVEEDEEEDEGEGPETPAPFSSGAGLLATPPADPPPPEPLAGDDAGTAAPPRQIPTEILGRIGEDTGAPPPFALDLPKFVEDMLARARNDDPARFADWLSRTVGEWPFTVKATAARDVLEAVRDAPQDVAPANFEAIARVFAFDDVLSDIPPLALAQLRQRLGEQQGSRRYTLIAAFLVWIVLLSLRFFPGESSDRSLDAARLDASAMFERTEMFGKSGDLAQMQRTAVVMVARFGDNTDSEIRLSLAKTMYDRGYFLSEAGRPDEALAAFDEFLSRFSVTDPLVSELVLRAHHHKAVALYLAGRPSEALREGDIFLANHPPEAGPADRERLVIAMALRGYELQQIGRIEEAIAAWDAVEARFGQSDEFAVRAKVALALLDKAGILKGNAAIAVYDLIISRYGADDGLKDEVAQARLSKGRLLKDMGRIGEARAELERLARDYGGISEKNIQALVVSAKQLLESLPPPKTTQPPPTATKPSRKH